MNRRDGIRVKNLDAMHVLMPYIKLMQDILNKPESLEENVNEKIRETTKLKY